MDNNRYAVLARTIDGEIRSDGWEYIQDVRYRKIFDADVSKHAMAEEYNNFAGKEMLYIEAPGHSSIESIDRLERELNWREFYANSNVRYRVLPHGVKIQNMPAPFLEKVIVRCAYCGQFGARSCECPKCGAPIM